MILIRLKKTIHLNQVYLLACIAILERDRLSHSFSLNTNINPLAPVIVGFLSRAGCIFRLEQGIYADKTVDLTVGILVAHTRGIDLFELKVADIA